MTKLRWETATWASGCAFLAYAGGSIAFSSVSYDKAWAGVQLGTLALAFLIGTRSRLEWVWLSVVLVTGINVIQAGMDWAFGWTSGFEGYPGFLGNPNIFGCFLVIALAAALSFRWWWFLPFVALGFLEIRSRGSILALGITMAIWFWPERKVCSFCSLVFSFVAIMEISSGGGGAEMIGEAAREAGEWGGREIGVMARMGVWQDTLNHLTLLGSGFGSFFEAYWTWPVHTNLTLVRPTHAYNDFLELVFELGLGAIFLWLFLALLLDRGISLIIWAFFALTLTYFPLSLPVLGHLFAFTLGSIYKEQRHGALEAKRPALPQGSWN